jgi:peptidoglycan/LPS O-acetylase OafA/YrhL
VSTLATASVEADPYYPALDGVRGLAILMVLLHNPDLNLLTPSFGDWLFGAAMHAGWVGVQLFFVLSGFLISDHLLRSHGATNYYTGFYARRLLRIFPLYYAVLFVFFVALPFVDAQPQKVADTAHHQIWLWTFLSNWTNPLGLQVHGFGHFWSLAVEEQFYLLWPLVVHRLSARQLFWVSIGIAVIALLLRSGMRAAGATPEMVYQFTFCRMDALALGAALASAFRIPEWSEYIRRRWLPLIAVSLVPLVSLALATRGLDSNDVLTQTAGHTILSVAFTALIAASVVAPRDTILHRVMAVSPMRSLGRYSYGMYVLHLPLHAFWLAPVLAPRLEALNAPGTAAGYIGCVAFAAYAAAVASYHLLEVRVLGLKHRFAPRHAGGTR